MVSMGAIDGAWATTMAKARNKNSRWHALLKLLFSFPGPCPTPGQPPGVHYPTPWPTVVSFLLSTQPSPSHSTPVHSSPPAYAHSTSWFHCPFLRCLLTSHSIRQLSLLFLLTCSPPAPHPTSSQHQQTVTSACLVGSTLGLNPS